MIYTYYIIPLYHISKKYNLPADVIYYIYSYIINIHTQMIINKWYSYVSIHNTNLCYIANKITLLQGYTFTGDIIMYYNLYDKNFYKTLYICAKYIKPNISSKSWWNNFIQNGYNGMIFIDYYDNSNDHIIHHNLHLLNKLYNYFN